MARPPSPRRRRSPAWLRRLPSTSRRRAARWAPLGRFWQTLSQTEEDRLAEEVRAWAEEIPGSVRIADARPRQRVKLAGVVRRITLRPVRGFQALEAVLFDGTGEVTAVWLGRHSIPGLLLGSRLVLEGVLGEERGRRRIVNPTFEFASDASVH